jgi:S1-C subfamily serine protease
MPEHRHFQRMSFALSGPNAMSYIHSVARLLQVELTSPGSPSAMLGKESGIVRVQLRTPPDTLGIRCAEVGNGKTGLLIAGVEGGSVGEKAGLAYAQTITHVDGKEVTSVAELADMFDRARSRGSITFHTCSQSGVERTVEITW